MNKIQAIFKELIFGMLCFVALLGGFAQNPYESYTNALEAAFTPDARTGVIRGEEIRRLIGSIQDMPSVQRYEIESNICQRILDFPLTTNAHTTSWALVQKRSLFYDMARLDYWKTNRTAMLELADHLGTHSIVATNFFQAEFSKADELDRIELDKARDQYKSSGTWPNNFTRERLCFRRKQVQKRFQLVKIWNQDIRQYRSWFFGAFSNVVYENFNVLPPEEKSRFKDEFIRRGKLSLEEVRQVFGLDGALHIECPSLDEVTAVFKTNRNVVAVAKAFSQIEDRLMPYWAQEPYKSDMRIDRRKYELSLEYMIMSQNVDASSFSGVFSSFEAKMRLSRALSWFSYCPTNRYRFMFMAYHLKRDYSHDKADAIRDFWMADLNVNPRLLPYGPADNSVSVITQNTDALRKRIKRYRGEVLGISCRWAQQFKKQVTAEEYQSAKEEFSKIADLTPEEVRQVFGSLPESMSGGPTTNLTTTAP